MVKIFVGLRPKNDYAGEAQRQLYISDQSSCCIPGLGMAESVSRAGAAIPLLLWSFEETARKSSLTTSLFITRNVILFIIYFQNLQSTVKWSNK
jgi:hypothetical protein